MKTRNVLPLLAFLFLFSTSLLAQKEFAPLGAKWYYDCESWIAPFPFSLPKNYAEKVTCSDTITIGGKFGKKINTLLEFGINVFYQNKDSVFYLNPKNNQWNLIYVFGLKQGDTYTIVPAYVSNPIPQPMTITVNSVSTIIKSGDTLKVQHISWDNKFWRWGNEIIEGIGNVRQLLPIPSGFDPNWDCWGVRCYETPTQIYHFVDIPCDTTYLNATANLENTAQKIYLSPNPSVTNVLQLHTTTDVALDKIQFFSLDGQLRQVISLENQEPNNLILNLSHGMYWAVFIKNGQSVAVQKMVLLE